MERGCESRGPVMPVPQTSVQFGGLIASYMGFRT